jgi:phosphatidylserine/phosphatidylglycerophosphate/cardiolipin synthase-like enzyme
MSTLFSPTSLVMAEIIHQVDQAKTSIRVAIYRLTFTPLIQKLIEKSKTIDVKIILDHSQMIDPSVVKAAQALVDGGVPVLITDSVHKDIMHSKYIVIDGTTLIYGSYNFSFAAARQSNVTTIISGDTVLAGQFLEDWQSIWDWGSRAHPDWQRVAGQKIPLVAKLRAALMGMEE